MNSNPTLSTVVTVSSLRPRTLFVAPIATVHGSGLSSAGFGGDDAMGLSPRGAPV